MIVGTLPVAESALFAEKWLDVWRVHPCTERWAGQ